MKKLRARSSFSVGPVVFTPTKVNMKRLVASVTALLCLACQTYSVVPYTGVRPGNDVRVAVTNEGSLAVMPIVGRDVQSVDASAGPHVARLQQTLAALDRQGQGAGTDQVGE